MSKKKIVYPSRLEAMKMMPPMVHRPEADRAAGGFRPENSKVFEWILKGGAAYDLAEMVFTIAERWGLVCCPPDDEAMAAIDEHSHTEDGEVWKYWGCCIEDIDESIKYHGKPVCELPAEELPHELRKLGDSFGDMRIDHELLISHLDPTYTRICGRIAVDTSCLGQGPLDREKTKELNARLINAQRELRAGNECNRWIRNGQSRFLFAGFIFDMAMGAGYVQYNKDGNTWQGINYREDREHNEK